jgi:hypothetical protein
VLKTSTQELLIGNGGASIGNFTGTGKRKME